jgi:hypothetical protein
MLKVRASQCSRKGMLPSQGAHTFCNAAENLTVTVPLPLHQWFSTCGFVGCFAWIIKLKDQMQLLWFTRMSENSLLFRAKINGCSSYSSVTYKGTNFMKKSPSWEADDLSPGQEILHLLWNLKVHYHIHNKPPLDPIPIQVSLVHTDIDTVFLWHPHNIWWRIQIMIHLIMQFSPHSCCLTLDQIFSILSLNTLSLWF